MTPPRLLPALLLSVAACGGDSGGDDPDAAPVDGANDPIDGGDEPDDGGGACAGDAAPAASIGGTEGIAIAPDGTIYYSQTGHVGRWAPGDAEPDDGWVALTGASTVWGMALGADGTLYVATPNNPDGGAIWAIDPDAGTPELLHDDAGAANGLTIGPDGAVYYSDISGDQVYRVDLSGTRTTVTASPINGANGVLFDPDGTLLVLSYATGDVLRLTLDGTHQELDRDTVVDAGEIDTGSPDGLARDDLGRHYVTDNSGGRVLRFDAAWTDAELLLDGVGSAANMAFGRGALTCDDLYVTSSGAMRRISAGAPGVP